MRKYTLYKHDNSTDLIVSPLRVIYLKKPERIIVKANLYTTGYPGKIHFQDKAEWSILKEDYNKWRLYEPS